MYARPEGNGPLARLAQRTGNSLQYNGHFRCPREQNGLNCSVDVWLRLRDGGGWEEADRRSFNIANDGAWNYVAYDDWPDAGGTDVWELWINARRGVLDVDTQWVSSGY